MLEYFKVITGRTAFSLPELEQMPKPTMEEGLDQSLVGFKATGTYHNTVLLG
jgi:hypothetical protein